MGKSVIIEKAKKVSEEQVQKALFIGLGLFIMMYPAVSYLCPYHPVGNQVQVWILLGMALYLSLLFMIQKINGRSITGQRNIASYSLVAMLVFGLFSCIRNGNLETTVWGDGLQGECLLVFASYYLMCIGAMQLKEKKYRKGLVFFLVLVLGFIALYGIMQFFRVPFMRHKPLGAAVLPAKNQNFYAAFPIMLNGPVFAKILYGENGKRKKTILWYVLLAISYGACLGAKSLLVYLGIIMQIVFLIFADLITGAKNKKKIALVVTEFVCVYVLLNFLSGGSLTAESSTIINQIEAEGTVFGDSVGTGRVGIWKETLKMISKRWVFGYGIACLDIHYTSSGQLRFSADAHNEYLQIWATQGTFAIIAYLVFLFALFIPGLLQFIKKERYDSDFASKAAMIAFFGYIAQAFANIRVIQVAPYFWIICGLLYLRRKEDKSEEKGEKASVSNKN